MLYDPDEDKDIYKKESLRRLRAELYRTPVEAPRKVAILQLAERIPAEGQNLLLKIIEEPPEHLLFILATTELQKVQLQTRIEMWGESGLEWFNNRRWNIPVNRQGSTVHWNSAMTYPVSQMTMKVPSEEISSNPNFGPQNP